MRHLQEMYLKYRDKGVVVLGINCSDGRKITLEFLAENSATFPNILDTSPAAVKTCLQEYQTGGSAGVPLSYIIDRQGKIVAAWYGEHDKSKVTEMLQRLGVK